MHVLPQNKVKNQLLMIIKKLYYLGYLKLEHPCQLQTLADEHPKVKKDTVVIGNLNQALEL